MPQFADICRQRQELFRERSTAISASARAPLDDMGKRHRYLLALGCEEENLYPSLRGPKGAIQFFNSRNIKRWRSRSTGDNCSEQGPTRNLLSSQIFCVNFLLPLCTDLVALSALLQEIDPNVSEAAPIGEGEHASLVEFEWIGATGSLEGGSTRGANVTSADALLIGRSRGELHAYVIEWKYTEKYPLTASLCSGPSGEKRRARYTPLFLASDSSFSCDLPIDELFYEPLYQLTRLRLLADAIVRDKNSDIKSATVVAICPAENTNYREDITSPELLSRFPDHNVESIFKSLFKDPGGFRMIAPSLLLEAVRRKISKPLADWSDYLADRYRW